MILTLEEAREIIFNIEIADSELIELVNLIEAISSNVIEDELARSVLDE